MNIHDTKITVYKGVNYAPDGTSVPWKFCTADFPPYEDGGYGDGGEYIFAVDENGDLYPVSPVGNGVEWEDVEVYENYCAMIKEKENENMTHGDKIRQMTDEELSDKLIDKLTDRCAVCAYHNAECETSFCVCAEGVLKWLKQEAETDATDN